MRYQFQVDGRGFGAPIRKTWSEAAADAVRAGYALWHGTHDIKISDQASIERIEDDND